MKKILFGLLALTSISAFATEEQCLASPITGNGFFNGYRVHCVGQTDRILPVMFSGQAKLKKKLASEMDQLGLVEANTFESGDIYFVPRYLADQDGYVLATSSSYKNMHPFKLKAYGIELSSSTFSGIQNAAEKLQLSFVWKFKEPSTGFTYVIYKKSL